MIQLNFPDATLRIKKVGSHLEIFDPLRKKFVVMTEEEWVRQHLIDYLLVHKLVPMHMMASERGLLVNKMPKRFDLLVFTPDGKPAMIVECKAPHITVNEDVFYQAARYNLTLQVNYLLITNGLVHNCFFVNYQTGEIRLLDEIPMYQDLFIDLRVL